MFSPTSRYANIPTASLTDPSGRQIVYVRRRFLPRPESLPLLAEVTVTQGDRLDLITAYDPNLNPIRAKVSLGLRVLNYNDFPIDHPGFAMFMVHQVVKEVMSVIGSVGNVANYGVNLF